MIINYTNYRSNKSFFKRKILRWTSVDSSAWLYYFCKVNKYGYPQYLFNSFFPSVFTEWNSLYHEIWNAESFRVFKNNMLKFIRPSVNSVFNCEKYRGIKLITILHVSLSRFSKSIKSNLQFSFDVESFSTCSSQSYVNWWKTYPLSTIKNIDFRLPESTVTDLIKTLLFKSGSVNTYINTHCSNGIYLNY